VVVEEEKEEKVEEKEESAYGDVSGRILCKENEHARVPWSSSPQGRRTHCLRHGSSDL
jgi:hypothetical protein